MIVEWSKTRLKIIPVKNLDSKITGGVNSVKLLPGKNEIPDDLWEELKKFSSVRKSIELEFLVEGETVETEKGKDGKPLKGKKVIGKTISDYKGKGALKLIKETYNLETLEQWKKDERSDIRLAIEERIKEIKEDKTQQQIGK